MQAFYFCHILVFTIFLYLLVRVANPRQQN